MHLVEVVWSKTGCDFDDMMPFFPRYHFRYIADFLGHGTTYEFPMNAKTIYKSKES